MLSLCEPPNREASFLFSVMKLSMKGAQAHSGIRIAYIDIKVNVCQIGSEYGRFHAKEIPQALSYDIAMGDF